MDGMFHQYAAHDEEVSAWLAKQGWPVTLRFYDAHRDVFMRKHQGPGPGAVRALHITLTTMEDVPPLVLTEFLNGARVADKMNANPKAYVVVRRGGAGQTELAVRDAPPE